jgi:SAM-dependent methyltransferase
MNPHIRFWSDNYQVDRPLEVDSLWHRLVNRYLVSTIINTFPKTATKIFSRSKGKLARLMFVDREGASYLVLRAIYEHNDPANRGDLLNRMLMESPAVKAARNRRIIAKQMLLQTLRNMPADTPLLVLAIGGGDGNFEAEAIAASGNPNVYLCIVDMDKRTIAANENVMKQNGLDGKGVVFVGTVFGKSDVESVIERAGRHFGVHFDGLSVTVCQGLVEYLDLGVEGNAVFDELLAALHACTRTDGALLLSQTDFHDRVRFFTRGLSVYMRLRGQEEIEEEVEKTGWQIAVCESEPMKLITMCSAIKTDRKNLRIDGPSRIGRTHVETANQSAKKTSRHAPRR